MNNQSSHTARAMRRWVNSVIRLFIIHFLIRVYIMFQCGNDNSLTLCIRETPKWVLLQTVKTHMKCSMLHFIRVYTVCKGIKDFQTKEYNILLIVTWHPRYVEWTIPSLLYQSRRKNLLIHACSHSILTWNQTGENMKIYDTCMAFFNKIIIFVPNQSKKPS